MALDSFIYFIHVTVQPLSKTRLSFLKNRTLLCYEIALCELPVGTKFRVISGFKQIYQFMMGKLYCCATNCHNYSGKSVNNRKVTLHRFPVNKRHKGIWKNRISRKNWKPTSCSRLCSEHFVSLSGPTKEHPLPSIFHHKVFKTTNVGGFCFNIAYAYVHKYKIIILHMCNQGHISNVVWDIN